jgi:hypothetical protein
MVGFTSGCRREGLDRELDASNLDDVARHQPSRLPCQKPLAIYKGPTGTFEIPNHELRRRSNDRRLSARHASR